MSDPQQSATIWSGRFRELCSAALICVYLAFIPPRALCQTNCSPEDDTQTFTIGAGSFISLPLGRFLLVRKNGHIGAIRITSISPDKSVQPRGSEWVGKVAYESYYDLNSGSFIQTVHTGQLEFGCLKGVGFHYSWQPGNNKALIGPWKFGFMNPLEMFMGKYMEDSGFEFAPTASCDITAIPIHDDHLRWFHYDRDTQNKLPVSGLPGNH
jgi:hypothetical protein